MLLQTLLLMTALQLKSMLAIINEEITEYSEDLDLNKEIFTFLIESIHEPKLASVLEDTKDLILLVLESKTALSKLRYTIITKNRIAVTGPADITDDDELMAQYMKDKGIATFRLNRVMWADDAGTIRTNVYNLI